MSKNKIRENPSLINIWIRSKSAKYGAQKYAQEILNTLNCCENGLPLAQISYMTPKAKSFIVSALLYIPWIFRKRKPTSEINIYTFPFMPFHLDPNYDILLFNHADPLRGSLKSRLTEFFGLIFLLFAPRQLLIVTIAPFWEKFLKEKFQFVNVKTIYIPISTKIIQILQEKNSGEASSSKDEQRVGNKDNIKIYLGNASPKKGWPLALKIAKKVYPNANYWISGNHYNYVANNEVNHFQGSYQEFIEFLQSVDISIFYSQFLEGWNITLIEAALLSQSYVLGYSKSGGAVDAMSLLPNAISFNNEDDLYQHLLNISKNQEFPNNKFEKNNFTSVLSVLDIENFYKEWHSLINIFLNANNNNKQ